MRKWIEFGLWVLLLGIGGFLVGQSSQVSAQGQSQIPTVAIATVTGSPSGAMVTVTREYDQVNVRSGPGGDGVYPIVGVLIAGQQVPALGRSAGGDWVQIAYPGAPGGVAWVYSPLVEVVGTLRVVEPPPTPTPKTTPTVDPTLAAQFIIEIPPTHLPTFTAPAPLVIPTYPPEQTFTGTGRVPMGLVIVGLGILGLFGMVISLIRGR